MAGKRLLDVAALFNASRSVVQKHVALRTRQFEVYSKTSSLAKAVKGQTERFTETAKAASFLASRLNESPPTWASDNSTKARVHTSAQNEETTIPSTDSTGVDSSQPQSNVEEGLEQDHFYEPSNSNSSRDPVPKDDLVIQQEKANRNPLPDGTIPPKGSSLGIPDRDLDSTSKISPEPAKNPARNDVHQKSLHPTSCGESTIPVPKYSTEPLSSDQARKLQRQFEVQLPSQSAEGQSHSFDQLAQGHDEDIFYSPSNSISPVLSSLPRVKIPKQSGNIQGTTDQVQNIGINSDSFSSATEQISRSPATGLETTPDSEEIPEGINTDLFHSPRVAKLLGGRTQTQLAKAKDLSPTKGNSVENDHLAKGKDEDVRGLAEDIVYDSANPGNMTSEKISPSGDRYEMRESKVPSSRIGRLWNYGGLAAGMFGGAVSESLRRATGNGGEGSFMLSAGNMDRLVAKLSRMRGAALKLGQMMSFQDSKMLPAPIQQVLLRVQDNADYMPASQRNKVLEANLGADWRELFDEFEEKPIAAASIGQVHRASLKSGEKVAVKVQYPGVADSIDSDLSNLAVLLTASRLLPKGLYLDKTIANARIELAWECDYLREAECAERFNSLLSDEKDVFVVPKVFPEASGKQVLTMGFMEGVGVTKVQNFTQEQKNRIGTQILRLCLREITEFRFMQTDPNWTNFLYNADTNKVELLDFGASREYPQDFISNYTSLLLAASKSDKDTVRLLSIDLGYLTGHESKAMLNAHIASVLTLAEPFLASSPEVYDFKDQTITERVKALIPIMIKERLAPPPEETYSLHRKLSGAFLLCARLGSQVRCRELFENSMTRAGLA